MSTQHDAGEVMGVAALVAVVVCVVADLEGRARRGNRGGGMRQRPGVDRRRRRRQASTCHAYDVAELVFEPAIASARNAWEPSLRPE